jgi:protein subunit release factor B
MTTSELAFSVSIDDCEVQTFRSGGKGGQNQNKRDSGVRVIHHESGARGESREERSQLQNKRTAFRKMVDTPEFKRYIQQRMYGIGRAEAEVARAMERTQDFRIEVKDEKGRWVEGGPQDQGSQA